MSALSPRALAWLLLAALPAGCRGDDARRHAELITGGDVRSGKALITAHGCHACHEIPGIPGATGTVGPPLQGMANRAFIGGVLANSPDNMVRWLMDPQAVDSLTAMPRPGLDATAARHVASYLYTLR